MGKNKKEIFICTKTSGIDNGVIYKGKEYNVFFDKMNNNYDIQLENVDIPKDYIYLTATKEKLLNCGHFKL